MKLPRKLFKTLIFTVPVILLVLGTSQAGMKGVSIKADSISYTKDKGIIIANGSVEARYKDSTIEADRIVFFTEEAHVISDGNFSLSRDKSNIKGEKLDYFFRSEKGTANNVRITMGSTWIKGKNITMDKEQTQITNAEMSSCDLENPHYKISASNMTFYSKSGWIVEYMGLFWLNDIPVFPVPTYVYDTGIIGGLYRKKNPAPLPEISSNDTDGFYIDEKVVWRLSSYSYGLLGLSYGSKKGIGIGGEGNYVLNDSNEGNIRAYTYGSDGFYGGATHTYYFGEPVQSERLRPLLYEVLQTPPKKKYDLTFDVSYRERINYERVSTLPMVTFRYIDVPFSFLDFNPKVEISAGSVSEESSGINIFKGNIKSSFDYVHPLTQDIPLRLGVDASYTGYDSSSRWFNVLGRVDVNRKFSDVVEAGMGYSHYFINDGGSPFRFENYRYFPFDDVRAHVSYKIMGSTLGIAVSYNTPLFTVRDIDYNATIGMHCFDTTVTWRAARREFALGVTLATN